MSEQNHFKYVALCFCVFVICITALNAVYFAFNDQRRSSDHLQTLINAQVTTRLQAMLPDALQRGNYIKTTARQVVTSKLHDLGLGQDQLYDTVQQALVAYAKETAKENAVSNQGGRVRQQTTGTGSPTRMAGNQPKPDIQPIDPEVDPVAGNLNARYQFIVYSDYECPFCKKYWPTIKYVIQNYGNRLAITLRDFPLPFHGRAAKREAQAAECVFRLAGDDAFWKYSDMIYAKTRSNGRGIPGNHPLVSMAASIGIDKKHFKQCLNHNPEIGLSVRDDFQSGRHLGVRGTPTTFIYDTKTDQYRKILGAQPLSAVTSILDKLPNAQKGNTKAN